jgi:endonuclease/exonuclease/phosphatase (EEP) superfamily protein YafD
MPVLPAIGWVICALLAAVVVAHQLQTWFAGDEGPVVAVAYDLLPLALFTAPVIAIGSLTSGRSLLALAAGLLTVYQVVLVVPHMISNRIPRWARQAPRFRLAVANVYVDNPTPEEAACQLVGCGAEVVVIAEATPAFMATFDAAGGNESHPHRVVDPTDTSDYAVAIASRIPLERASQMRRIGPLNLAVAKIRVDGVLTTIAALNPRATFDPGGYDEWRAQMDALKSFIPEVDGPLVVAGDLNTTRFRPEFQQLLDAGLVDCIDALGQARKPSFSLRSVLPLGPWSLVMRLDHALANDGVRPLRVRNLEARGSDHLPFLITLAVRNRETEPSPPEATHQDGVPVAPS